MPSYRFCRTDDIPLLVEAHNSCYQVHFPELAPLTVQGYKRAVRDLSLWASSCMVALAGDEPIGVLLAAKREAQTLIWRLGVRPDEQRRGHAHHLLESLKKKVTILGPPQLVAEVPEDYVAGRALLERLGFRTERTYTDFIFFDSTAGASEARELVAPVGLDDLLSHGALDPAIDRCWQRAATSLVSKKDSIRGWAVASEERIEAYLLYEQPDTGSVTEILALGATEPSKAETWLRLLLRHHREADKRPLRLARTHPAEVSFELLRKLGFSSSANAIGYSVSV